MTVLSKYDVILANSSLIGERYIAHVKALDPDIKIDSVHTLLRYLYQNVGPVRYRNLQHRAEAKVVCCSRNLIGSDAVKIMHHVTSYLNVKMANKGKMPLIEPLVREVSVYGGEESILNAFAVQHFGQQRHYLQHLADTIEILMAVYFYNDYLVHDTSRKNFQRYQYHLFFGDRILEPGKAVMTSAYLLQNLLAMENFYFDMDEYAGYGEPADVEHRSVFVGR